MFTERNSCCMNLMQCHDDSLKESLKQTMLNQENLFRKQVQELHRLYQIQMILMKNLRLKEVHTTQSLNYIRQDCRVNWARYDQPLDLEVPASSCTSNFDNHFLKNGNGWVTVEDNLHGETEPSLEEPKLSLSIGRETSQGLSVGWGTVEDYFHGKTESSIEEAKLSLSIGREISQRTSVLRPQNEKVRFIVLQDTHELEESVGTLFSRDVVLKAPVCCGACSVHSGERNGSQASCNCTNSTDKCLSSRARNSQSHRDESINILENSLNLGQEIWHENCPETEAAVGGEVFPSHGSACLDLNSPQPDESSLDIKQLKVAYSSSAASPNILTGEFHKCPSPDAGSWTKLNDNCSTQVSTLLQHETPNSVQMVCRRTHSMNPSGNKMLSIDLESYPMSPSEYSEDHDCRCKKAQSMEDFPIGNCKDETEVIIEKGDEVLVHSCLCSSGAEVVAINERSPDFTKSDHIAQDPSSSLKTMQSGTYLEKSFSRMNSFQNSDSSQVDSSAIGESKARSSDEGNLGLAHDDPVMQKGAVSLVYFLLEARREHDCTAKIKKTNDVAKEKIDQPECSMDSFESIVLKLQENKTDDYCVSSNPYEINDMDKKESGIKLRRGRRLKDFQKEILPSLPSLSRQEICEDIRIMEGAIRSREYKRFQSKITTQQNWFTPVRSRRSRLNYIGRRCYK